MPEPLENEPSLPVHLMPIMSAFESLSYARTYGFASANPVSIADMSAYWCHYQPCEFGHFTALIQGMDEVFLTWQAAAAKKS